MTDFLPVKIKGFLANTMEQQGFSYWGMGDPPLINHKIAHSPFRKNLPTKFLFPPTNNFHFITQ